MNKIKYVYTDFISKKIAKGFIILLSFYLLSQIVGILPPLLFGKFLDGFSSEGYRFAVIIISLFALSHIANLALGVIREKYDLNNVTFEFSEYFQCKVLGKLKEKPLSFFLKNHTGKQLSEINKGFNGLQSLIFQSLFWIIPTIFMIGVTIVTLLIIQPLFGLLAILSIALYSVSLVVYWKSCVPRIKGWAKVNNKYYGSYSDLIRNTTEIKIAGAEEMHERYLWKMKGVNHYGRKMWWRLFIIQLPASITLSFSMVAVLILGVYLLKNGSLTVGGFSAVFIWFSRMIKNMSAGTGMLRTISRNVADISRLIDLVQEEDNTSNGTESVDLRNDSIDFKDVSFLYENSKEHAVKDLNFSIKPGKFVAFVGPSGAGKSTVFKMLLQGISPNSGSVTCGGKNILDIDPKVLLNQIAFIPQEKLLFDTSLRSNISLGLSRDDVSDEKIFEVLDELGLSSLKDRLHKTIGENGKELSGGERQRILIARAMLKEEANLILLDEPTSALDSESEQKIRETIAKLKKRGKTIIMIAHRLTIVQDADEIIVLDKGEVVSSGNHLRLVSGCGLYQKMVKGQTLVA